MKFRVHFSVVYTYEVLTQQKSIWQPRKLYIRVNRGYNGTFRIFLISNLCTYLSIIGSSICGMYIWNSFPIAFNLLDNDFNIKTIKYFLQNQLSKREKTFCKIRRDITSWMRLYIHTYIHTCKKWKSRWKGNDLEPVRERNKKSRRHKVKQHTRKAKRSALYQQMSTRLSEIKSTNRQRRTGSGHTITIKTNYSRCTAFESNKLLGRGVGEGLNRFDEAKPLARGFAVVHIHTLGVIRSASGSGSG